MSNMSYCRFQNTLIDLRDCKYELDEMVECQNMSEEACVEEDLEHANTLSKDEAEAALLTIDLAIDIAAMTLDSDLIQSLKKAAGREA